METTIRIEGLRERKGCQLVYVESQYDHNANDIVSHRYDEIRGKLRRCGIDFVYQPQLIKQIAEDSNITAYYAFGSLSARQIQERLCSFNFLDHATDKTVRNNTPPSLLYIPHEADGEPTDAVLFNIGLPAAPESLNSTFKKVIALHREREKAAEERICFRRCDEDDEDFYSGKYDKETETLISEVRDKLFTLHQRGVAGSMLHRLVDESLKPSQLMVGEDFSIRLADYGNREVSMPALPKALFLLFLRHVEGIEFKRMEEHKAELAHIYLALCHGKPPRRWKRSIDDICNPLSNSINEKCSRVAQAFKREFDACVVRHYIISGGKGEKKRITIDRALVEWQCGDIMAIEFKPSAMETIKKLLHL
ncbi:MAG: hypothetical protein ACI3Y0_06290 [Prevotella sp.]